MHADREAGFTLIEMLVAIAIFGVMAAAGYRVLDTVLVTRERVGDEYRRWRDVARAVAWIERDLEAVQARPVRNPADEVLAPLVGVEGFTQPDRPVVTFTRSGSLDDSGFPAPPRRIGYRVRDGALERLVWAALDQATQSQPTATVVLRSVSKLGLRYRDAAGTWRANWPVAAGQDESRAMGAHVARSGAVDITLPTGVDVTIQLAGGEQIQRLIPLSSGSRS